MRNLLLELLREIRHSAGRFLSIMLIVALGTGFFGGIKATGPDMKETGDDYFRKVSLMDAQIVSTLGFSEHDLAAIAQTPGVITVQPTYSAHLMVDSGDKSLVVNVLALPDDEDYALGRALNLPRLVKGRMPAGPGECVVENNLNAPAGFVVGNTITLYSGESGTATDEIISNNRFEIVGIVESPLYLTYERGSTKLGNGTISSFIMVPKEVFAYEVYTSVYVRGEGAAELYAYSAEYDSLVEQLREALEDTAAVREPARYAEIHSEADEKLDDAKAELEDGRQTLAREMADAERKIAEAEQDITDGEQKLADAKIELADAEIELADGRLEGEQKLADALQELTDGEREYSEGRRELSDARRAGAGNLEQLAEAIDALTEGIEQMQQGLYAAIMGNPALEDFVSDPASYSAAEAAAVIGMAPSALQPTLNELYTRSVQLVTYSDLYYGGYYSLKDASAELAAARRKLDKGWREYEEGKEEFEREILDAEQKIAEGHEKIAEAEQDMADGRVKLADARRELAEARADAEADIADAEVKIADAERELADIDEPSWYIFLRDDLPGFAEYGANADRIDAIARVFPLFFILVAALVSLTTMTRMVEDARTQIGTLKALGYGAGAIAMKFILYAAAASLLGSALGLGVGMYLFPTVIFRAYLMMVRMQPLIVPFRWGYAAACTAAAVLCTSLAALSTCYSELKAEPASLMRPRSPKAGKRVLLERLPFIWNRLSFLVKVTVRNLFRYKKRILMTVLGIAGCTALLLGGFGLYDSISAIAENQFEKLFLFDLTAVLEEHPTQDEFEALLARFEADSSIATHLLARQKSVDSLAGRGTVSANLFVPQSVEDMRSLFVLRDRLTHEPVQLSDSGAIVSEKLLRLLDAEVGGQITVRDEDDVVHIIPIAGSCEHYAGHYIYLTPALFERITGAPAEPNVVFLGTAEGADATALASEVLGLDGILYVNNKQDLRGSFDDMIQALGSVIWVIIVSAGSLAFVVLYNLTNINVHERMRELATIKVLGFYDREVTAYIFRENAALVLMGIACGLVAGVYLHGFIVRTAEVEQVMFGRIIEPPSFVYAAITTLLFAVVVNIFIHFRLKRIDMVESLKSVE